jgi:hypothetical protein
LTACLEHLRRDELERAVSACLLRASCSSARVAELTLEFLDKVGAARILADGVLPLLRRTSAARVVSVTSQAYRSSESNSTTCRRSVQFLRANAQSKPSNR